jgi:hypothetical protein
VKSARDLPIADVSLVMHPVSAIDQSVSGIPWVYEIVGDQQPEVSVRRSSERNPARCRVVKRARPGDWRRSWSLIPLCLASD